MARGDNPCILKYIRFMIENILNMTYFSIVLLQVFYSSGRSEKLN